MRVWPVLTWDRRRAVTSLLFKSERASSWLLAIARLIAGSYLAATWAINFATTSKPQLFLSYLTTLSWMLTWMYFLASSVTAFCTLYQFRYPLTKEQLGLGAISKLVHLSTFLFELATPLELVVAPLYWSAIWTGPGDPDMRNPEARWFNVTAHGCCSVSLLINLLIGGERPLDNHIIFLLIFAFGYMGVNAAVSLEVAPVYRILTWKKPSDAAWVCGALTAMVLAFYATSFIAFFRDRAALACRRWRQDKRSSVSDNGYSLVLLQPGSSGVASAFGLADSVGSGAAGGAAGGLVYSDVGALPCSAYKCCCRARKQREGNGESGLIAVWGQRESLAAAGLTGGSGGLYGSGSGTGGDLGISLLRDHAVASQGYGYAGGYGYDSEYA